jgi:hypothetical protein
MLFVSLPQAVCVACGGSVAGPDAPGQPARAQYPGQLPGPPGGDPCQEFATQRQPAKIDTKATKDAKIAKKVEIAHRAKRYQEIYFAIFVFLVAFVPNPCSRSIPDQYPGSSLTQTTRHPSSVRSRRVSDRF